MAGNSKKKEKKWFLLVVVIFLYLLFISSEEEQLGPEQLAAYRAELAQFVKDNEDAMRREQDGRREKVRQVCIKYGVNKSKQNVIPPQARDLELEEEEWAFLRRINWQYMYWSPQHDMTWCKVPKAGSSTWTYNFLKLAGQDTNTTKIHKLLRDFYPKEESNRVMHETFKFMVVRHPFERLLSAYRDKLEDINRDLEAREGFYYSTYGKHIVEEYRKRKGRRNNQTEQLEPTWREFITYILNTPAYKFDEHWTPIWMLCSPCIVRYNVISKMENFAEDTQYTLNAAGLQNELVVEWKHRTGTGGSTDTILEYFSQLTQSEIGALFKKYQLDFELYGYSPEPFFEIASKDPAH